VPAPIEKADPLILKELGEAIQKWIDRQARPQAADTVLQLFSGTVKPAHVQHAPKAEEKWQHNQWDLINWFVISNK
jgi:hypothetical protein